MGADYPRGLWGKNRGEARATLAMSVSVAIAAKTVTLSGLICFFMGYLNAVGYRGTVFYER